MDNNWQASKSSLAERNSFMFNNEFLADVHFAVGNSPGVQIVFPAHKYVLATGSSVFCAMLFGGMANTEQDVIQIPDMNPPAFLNILRYLYTDRIELQAETVLATLYGAEKYMMPHLRDMCVKYLKESVEASNACIMLEQSRLFGQDELTERCLHIIDQTSSALESDNFLDISAETLLDILERDTLCVEEIDIYKAAVRWADAECKRQCLEPSGNNKRQVLGKALNLIRMPTMTMEQFAEGPADSGILSSEEIIGTFMYLAKQEKPNISFSSRPRKGVILRVERFKPNDILAGWKYPNCYPDALSFRVNVPVKICGVGFYGSCHDDTKNKDYRVTVSLQKGKTVLTSKTCKYTSEDLADKVPYLVRFDIPFDVIPDEYDYNIVATINGPNSYYGANGAKTVESNGVKFVFETSPNSKNGTSHSQGQIPLLLFRKS